MHPDEQRAIARRIGRRLRWPWHRDYARGKLRFDPAYAAVADEIGHSSDALLDVGCGLGLLGFYLREREYRGAYVGLDLDRAKIGEARRVAAAHYPDLVFASTDAKALPAFSGHVVLLDVLHYLERADQQTVLQQAVGRIAADGVLLLRTVLRTRGWRFRATLIEERVLHAMRWMRSPVRHIPGRSELEATLHAAGLTVDVRPLWGRTPFNSYFIVARRGPRRA